MVGAAEEVVDSFNLEVVSSFITADFHEFPPNQDGLNDINARRNNIPAAEHKNLSGLQQLRCNNSQQLVQFTILTDKSPTDTSWTLNMNSDALIASSPFANSSGAYKNRLDTRLNIV